MKRKFLIALAVAAVAGLAYGGVVLAGSSAGHGHPSTPLGTAHLSGTTTNWCGGGFDTGTNQVFPDGTSGDWSTVNTVNVANHCPNAAFIARLNTEVFTDGGSDIRARALATCEQQIPKVGLCSPGSQVIGTPGTSNDGVILQENSGQGSEGHAAGFVFTGMAPGPWQVEAQVQSSDGTGSDGVEWRTFTVDVYR